jgi:phospholipase/carboxylesterase
LESLEHHPEWVVHSSRFVIETTSLLRLPEGVPGLRPLVIALHGMGLTCEKFARTLSPLRREPWALFVPQGPYPFEIRKEGSMSVGHAWYMYRGDEEEWHRYMLRAERDLLDRMDDILRRYPIDPDRVFLVGHSQGCYLGYFVALRHPDRFRGFAAVGGRLKRRFLEPHLEASRGLPVLVLHGSEDRHVPVTAAHESRDLLASYGHEVECRIHPTGHWIHPAQVRDLARWIRKKLEDPPKAAG